MAKDYSMKIPGELADTFQKFIDRNSGLGYRKVSQYIQYILRNKAKEILQSNYEVKLEVEKSITLKSGTYSRDELRKLLEEQE